MNVSRISQPGIPLWKKLSAGIAVAAMVMSVALNAIIAGTSVDYGVQLRSMQKEELELALQKKELEAGLAEASSLHTLREEAEAKGFLPAKSIVYANSLPVALR